MKKFHKVISLFVVISMLLTWLPASSQAATSGTMGDSVTWTLDDNGTLTISGTGAISASSYSSYPWYSNRSSIIQVVIEEGITSIGYGAFRDYNSLTSVTIPEGVTRIDSYAFYSCESLTSVTIPASVTRIAECAFDSCSNLSHVLYGGTETQWSEISIIVGNNSLLSATRHYEATADMLSTVETCGVKHFCCSECGVFATIQKGTATHKWSNGVCTLCGVKDIWSYDIHTNGTVEITKYSGTDSVLVIPATIEGLPVTYIGYGAFRDCDSLTSVTIPEGVTGIDSYAFYSCDSLTSVTIPEGVTSIGNYAFEYCSSLTSVTIPEGVTSIGNYAFGGCYNLNAVYITDLAAWCNIKFDQHSYDSYNSANPLYCANNLYLNGQLVTDLVVPEGVTSIGDYAFYNYDNLTGVTIPNSVTSIGSKAFYGCSNLTDITIPDSVTGLGENVFAQCTNLTAATIGSGVTELVYGSFTGCSNLQTITIPETVTSIEQKVFYGCDELDHVLYAGTQEQWDAISIGSNNGGLPTATIHMNATEDMLTVTESCSTLKYNCVDCGLIYSKIKDVATHNFEDGVCTLCGVTSEWSYSILPNSTVSINGYAGSDTELTIPATLEGMTVTQIAYYAFRGNSNLQSIAIPEGVTSIGSYAFYSCDSLTSVTIPTSVTSIGSDAFFGCHNLNKVNISDVAAWCNISFYSYDSNPLYYGYGGNLYLNGELVTNLVIPEGVTSISDYAFYNYDNLTSVTIPDSVTSIGDGAFEECTGLTSVTIGNGVTSIGSGAFEWCTSLTSVTIPASVTSIAEYAFDSCSNLSHVFYSGTAAQWNNIFISNNTALTNATRHNEISAEEAKTMLFAVETCSMNQWHCKECGLLSVTEKAENSHEWSDGVCTVCGVSDDWSYYPYNNGITIDGYTGTDAEVVIPATIEGLPVTVIANNDFANYTNIISIVVPEGVTDINRLGCSNLVVLSLPQSLTYFNSGSYYNEEPAHVLYAGTAEQWSAIYKTNIFYDIIHYEATMDMVSHTDFCSYREWDCVECGMFERQIKTADHTFEDGICATCGVDQMWEYSVLSSGEICIDGVNGNPTNLIVPARIESLPVTTIASRAFYNAKGLLYVQLPDSVTTIGGSAFMYCKDLQEIYLGDGVESIGASAFRNCTSLIAITLPEGVTTTEAYTFSGCTSLSAVALPASFMEAYEWAFYNCKNVDHVIYGGTEAQKEDLLIDGTNDTILTATWHCEENESVLMMASYEVCSAVALYECAVCEATCWSVKEHPDHTYDNGACTACGLDENCKWSYEITGTGVVITGYDPLAQSKELDIPETIEGLPVVGISERAFVECFDVTSVIIPATVKTIGYSAFRDCTELADVYFKGTQEQWEQIVVDSNNAPLLQATLNYWTSLPTGDVDGNNEINSDDVQALLLHISMPDIFPININADYNGDGKVNSDDVTQLLLHISMPDMFPLYAGG